MPAGSSSSEQHGSERAQLQAAAAVCSHCSQVNVRCAHKRAHAGAKEQQRQQQQHTKSGADKGSWQQQQLIMYDFVFVSHNTKRQAGAHGGSKAAATAEAAAALKMTRKDRQRHTKARAEEGSRTRAKHGSRQGHKKAAGSSRRSISSRKDRKRQAEGHVGSKAASAVYHKQNRTL
eukprot:1140853-Pelagomonas_calceolata.AAC.1